MCVCDVNPKKEAYLDKYTSITAGDYFWSGSSGVGR